MKLGSLFDGSGGFPLAGSLCGIEPVWAAEVEPYPIAVTRSRFPNMKHLGSVTEVKGNEVEPVDVITFGSPCQDLSVAGKRAGLKHEVNGDEETTRSGLFMEAVRIIKEMREATNGVYPRFAVWENVPGAFSSNKGEDFRIVLEELVKIIEPDAVMPTVPKNGWPYADCYCGDGWSLAYRVYDAQFWGVPQRRRRIYLVADFRGQCAGKVSFEREGLRGYFAESGSPREAVAGDAKNCVGTADCAGVSDVIPINTMIATRHKRLGRGTGFGVGEMGDAQFTISAGHEHAVCYSFDSLASNSMKSKNPHSGCRQVEIAKRLDTTDPNPCKNQDGIAIVEPRAYAMQGFGDYKESDVVSGMKARDYKDATDLVVSCQGMDCRNGVLNGDLCGTLQAKPNGGFSLNCIHPVIIETPIRYIVGKEDVAGAVYVDTSHADDVVRIADTVSALQSRDYKGGKLVAMRYIVRRLTPTECARLQGFPDKWGHPDIKDALTDEEYTFWLNVRNTHAAINGKPEKKHTKEQILKWYNGLHTDSAEYKMWGNGIALPTALYVMQGIAEAGGK